MKKRTAGRAVFIIALVVAVLCIAIGINGVWRSFERFDNSILTEKDTQLYSLMRSGDINLENSINAIQREAETFLGRERLKIEISNWKESGSTSRLKQYISNNTLASNPIYADLVMNYNGKIVCTASSTHCFLEAGRPVVLADRFPELHTALLIQSEMKLWLSSIRIFRKRTFLTRALSQ